MGMISSAQAASNKIEADWDQRSLSAAIAAAREVTSGQSINSRASIGSLSEIEWTWICAAAVFGWIKTKSQQAVEEGTSAEIPIRTMTSRDPEPWEAGAIETILPALGNLELPWQSPLGEWRKEDIVLFAWGIHRLVSSAFAARDEGATDKIVRRISKDVVEREASARRGGPLLSNAEIISDDIPF